MRLPPRQPFLFALLCLFLAGPSEAVVLVKDGKPMATIIVAKPAVNPPANDSAAQKFAAARDLQAYVRKMSGAELPIVGDDAKPPAPWVIVGRCAAADALGANVPSGLTPARREEGFLILAKGDRLLLAGNDAGPYHGTEYAASELLERLGVRWYMPGEFGEFVPRNATIEVADEQCARRRTSSSATGGSTPRRRWPI